MDDLFDTTDLDPARRSLLPGAGFFLPDDLEADLESERIEAAALALPTKEAAKVIGDNIANAERVIKELELFDRVITVPILVVAFE